ncbi:hypothetical protein [Wolbachia endosymbiont of Phyllotreta cruciferae]|uniref:hypothetical protein n=1 Tax=Wolbachia endosymbiont of Phyllotreta cruciferae TaxID=2886377 RepID=UPI0035129BB0
MIKNTELPVSVIGATSNIIVRDSGIRGITVKLGKEFAYIKSKGNNSIVALLLPTNINVCCIALNGITFA